MSNATPIKLKVRQQDLDKLSLFPATAEAARDWAAALPIANPQAVTHQMATALDEINRCRMNPETRFAILEALGKNLLIASASLSRRFLNQPLVMPEELRQLAELVEDLYSQATAAYTCVAIEALKERDSIRGMNPARLVCEALLRGIEFSTRKLLLNFQLHQPVEINGWLTLHQLYALGERQELVDITLPGLNGIETSISRAYMVAMMLGCCKPNQLRQGDLALIYLALQLWSGFLKLDKHSTGDGLFQVDLERDQPPLYSALFRDGKAPHSRKIDSSGLVSHMENLGEANTGQGRTGIALDSNNTISKGLLSHVVDCLGTMSVRNFTRKTADGPLVVSLGLTAAHYHAAGERGFLTLLHGSNYIPGAMERVSTNPFTGGDSGSSHDLWSQANPEEDFEREVASSEPEAALSHQVQLDAHTATAIMEDGPELPEERPVPVYEVRMVNASPGGYCLEWPDSSAPDIKAGELVSVQETSGAPWSIATVRWVSQLQQSQTLLGLELLSPRAMAYGAVTRQKTGEESVPQRVLLLPEISLVGQPHTLITPRAGFRERQKITLYTEGEKLHVQLQRQIVATGSFSQFEFRYIRMLGDVIAEDKSGPLDSSYDSLWSNI